MEKVSNVVKKSNKLPKQNLKWSGWKIIPENYWFQIETVTNEWFCHKCAIKISINGSVIMQNGFDAVKILRANEFKVSVR